MASDFILSETGKSLRNKNYLFKLKHFFLLPSTLTEDDREVVEIQASQAHVCLLRG